MTRRLLGAALTYWNDLDGHATSQGLPELGKMPLGRLCNYIWWWVTRNADEEQYEKARRKLWIPPKGEAGQGPWAADEETRLLRAAKAALNSK